VNGTAGFVGNLFPESGVLPSRIEGSAAATPMRSANFAGTTTDFSPEEVMNRSSAANPPVGPRRPGIGLAQWTTPARRAGLFAGGASILFDMDGQVSYLVGELQANASLNASLSAPGVSVNNASDDVVYRFEIQDFAESYILALTGGIDAFTTRFPNRAAILAPLLTSRAAAPQTPSRTP
jgi:hypothetical protein